MSYFIGFALGLFWLAGRAYFSGHKSMRWAREWWLDYTLRSLAEDIRKLEEGK